MTSPCEDPNSVTCEDSKGRFLASLQEEATYLDRTLIIWIGYFSFKLDDWILKSVLNLFQELILAAPHETHNFFLQKKIKRVRGRPITC